MSLYFNLAHGTKLLSLSANYPWPYDIDVCFDPVPHPIVFSEGIGHGSAGCAVSAEEALESKWNEHFEATRAHWLIPYIERLAQGIPLPKDELIMRFEEMHGKSPTSYESRLS
ncbi:hypothetical protein ABXT21_19685 [Ralstonia sp. SM1864_UCD524_TZ4]|uniref:Uncharacterized protein n=1 Tax=Ralstonia solanacearum TaxID=305 RepID=A0A0S4W392_RALSL|nr:hypothetical protein [Ralstonia pseudosolanacearum]CUV22918.1 conserved protein of unknown function [Ralstonia solanacearum]CUV36805.1 conserved protein of unknown function [Ralstonia solanacearum]CUV40629.1 conserved protein of unknown function [Ralstonia solanacearum]CUV64175.1 conserved protein of unknown function [Ralstonia solanacearum]